MRTLYGFDESRTSNGEVLEIPLGHPIPEGFAPVAPPASPEGFAVWVNGTWRIMLSKPKAPPEPVPESVTKRQFVQQLIADDLYDSVEAILDAIPDTVERLLMWSWFRDSNEFERHRPELIQIAAQLGKSAAEIDDFFRRADAR